MFSGYTGGYISPVNFEGIEVIVLVFASTNPLVLASRFEFTTSIFEEFSLLDAISGYLRRSLFNFFKRVNILEDVKLNGLLSSHSVRTPSVLSFLQFESLDLQIQAF